MTDVQALSDTTWEAAVTRSNGPVLVLFHAPWAGPALLALDTFEDVEVLVNEGKLNVRLGTFDIDDNPHIPRRFGLKSVPSFMLFDGDVLKKIKVGHIPAEIIMEMVQ